MAEERGIHLGNPLSSARVFRHTAAMPSRLADLIASERVRIPLESATLADAALELVACLEDAGSLFNSDLLRERIEEARPENVVALADRAFVMHYRTEAVKELVVAVGLATRPVCRSIDEDGMQCARAVFLVCSPPRLAARHLQVVGALAKSLSKEDHIAALLAANSSGAVAGLQFLAAAELPAQLTVRDLMSAKPRTVQPDTLLRSAVLEMVRSGLGALPVVDTDDRVIGMLSERELLRDLLSRYLPRAGGVAGPQPPPVGRRTVSDLMSRQVLCVAPDQPLAEVASLMLNKDVDRVPVVKNDRLVGFLTRGDIVRKLIGS